MRKELPQLLLRKLLENSKRSDRELAKILEVSQPTVTRTRNRLEKSRAIEDYTIIPDFKEMGFELLAINFAKLHPKVHVSEVAERAKEFIAKFPSTIFASAGQGLGMNAVSISFYKDFTEYSNRVNLMRTEMRDIIVDLQSFVVPLGDGEFKRFSLTYLKDIPISKTESSGR